MLLWQIYIFFYCLQLFTIYTCNSYSKLDYVKLSVLKIALFCLLLLIAVLVFPVVDQIYVFFIF